MNDIELEEMAPVTLRASWRLFTNIAVRLIKTKIIPVNKKKYILAFLLR